MASTGAAAGAAGRNDSGSSFVSRASLSARVRAGTAVVLTISLCWLATARLRTGDIALGVRLRNVLEGVRYAQEHFAESCGHGGYAASLPQLRIVLTDFSDSFLNDVFHYMPGYLDALAVRLETPAAAAPGPPDCMSRPTTRAYHVSATYSWSYWRPSFAMGTDGVIWQSMTSAPPVEPFGPPATRLR